MKHLILATAAAASLAAAPAGGIAVEQAWVRAAPPGARTAAAYLTVINRGPNDDTLLGGSTPVATGFELHETSMAGGVMRMRPLARGLPVPAGATARAAPGGVHIMLTGLNRPLIVGQPVPATLRFARAGAVHVSFAVRPLGG